MATPQTTAAAEAASFVATFNKIILFPTIALLSAVAFLVFLWGVAQYFMNATNDQARQQGVQHITYGIIGLVVMLSAYAILAITTATFGLSDELKCANDPSGSGCDKVFVLPNAGGGAAGGGGNAGGGAAGGGGNAGGGAAGGG